MLLSNGAYVRIDILITLFDDPKNWPLKIKIFIKKIKTTVMLRAKIFNGFKIII